MWVFPLVMSFVALSLILLLTGVLYISDNLT